AVPASAVGLEGVSLQGMSYVLYNGRATWDYSGTSSQTTPTNPPPTANFAASPSSGQAPLAVQFTDQSTGTISSWDWNFGDGSTHSSTQNPVHTYNSAGSFTTTLTVTGTGDSNSKSLTISATTNTPPSGTNPPPSSIVDGVNLQPPRVGDNTLHVLSPTVLELHLINTKALDPATVTNWNFVDSTGNLTLPALSKFTVTVTGQS